MGEYWLILKRTAVAWNQHEAPRMGAALAYYSILSMAPLIVISIAIAGLAFGKDAAEGQIVYQMRDTVGEAGAQVLQDVLKNAHQPSSGIIATIFGLLMLLVGASGVFTELRSSLNRIWDVPAEQTSAGLRGTVRFYVISFAMVVTIGFLLLVSLVLSALLAIFGKWLANLMPGLPITVQIFNAVLSFVVVTIMFAFIYKFVPDARVRWEDVWQGALATALLFTIGKFALALYIARAGVGGAYGAAGSLVVLLVWVYYSAQIFFFGAEFTHIRARHAAALARKHGVGIPRAHR